MQHTTYLVSNLSPNTEYRFRVSAINRHGVSDPGPPSDVIITLDRLQSLAIGRLHLAFSSSVLHQFDVRHSAQLVRILSVQLDWHFLAF